MDMGILPLGDATATMNAMPPLSLKMGAPANIDKTARDFESMFATQMLQPMFEGLGVDQTFGGGHGEEVMRSFLLQEYGKLIAKSGKLGIASAVKAEMLRAQESSASAQSSPTALSTKGAAYGTVR